jgi:hypothetical protein
MIRELVNRIKDTASKAQILFLAGRHFSVSFERTGIHHRQFKMIRVLTLPESEMMP